MINELLTENMPSTSGQSLFDLFQPRRCYSLLVQLVSSDSFSLKSLSTVSQLEFKSESDFFVLIALWFLEGSK